MRLGPVQQRLLRRAHGSAVGRVMPSGFLERRALRRLQVRGFTHKVMGLPDVWEVLW